MLCQTATGTSVGVLLLLSAFMIGSACASFTCNDTVTVCLIGYETCCCTSPVIVQLCQCCTIGSTVCYNGTCAPPSATPTGTPSITPSASTTASRLPSGTVAPTPSATPSSSASSLPSLSSAPTSSVTPSPPAQCVDTGGGTLTQLQCSSPQNSNVTVVRLRQQSDNITLQLGDAPPGLVVIIYGNLSMGIGSSVETNAQTGPVIVQGSTSVGGHFVVNVSIAQVHLLLLNATTAANGSQTVFVPIISSNDGVSVPSDSDVSVQAQINGGDDGDTSQKKNCKITGSQQQVRDQGHTFGALLTFQCDDNNAAAPHSHTEHFVNRWLPIIVVVTTVVVCGVAVASGLVGYFAFYKRGRCWWRQRDDRKGTAEHDAIILAPASSSSSPPLTARSGRRSPLAHSPHS